jgi:hypothetical protein
MSWCRGYKSPAAKRYMRRIMIAMWSWVVIIFGALTLGRHVIKHGWPLYVMSVLLTLPVIGIFAIMGRYLQEETDEYRRLLAVRSLIIATGVLLTTIFVNDFLRVSAHWAGLPPFLSFEIFAVVFCIAQAIQWKASRGRNDE